MVPELRLAGTAMEDLAGTDGSVAVLGHPLRESGFVLQVGRFPDWLGVQVDAGSGGTDAPKESGPGRIAGRGGAVGVVEEDPHPGEAVDVWGLRLGVASHHADPVIEIIDRDEEKAGF